jgi:hypothetical protein
MHDCDQIEFMKRIYRVEFPHCSHERPGTPLRRHHPGRLPCLPPSLPPMAIHRQSLGNVISGEAHFSLRLAWAVRDAFSGRALVLGKGHGGSVLRWRCSREKPCDDEAEEPCQLRARHRPAMTTSGAGHWFLGRSEPCQCPVGDLGGWPPLAEWHCGGAGEPLAVEVSDLISGLSRWTKSTRVSCEVAATSGI